MVIEQFKIIMRKIEEIFDRIHIVDRKVTQEDTDEWIRVTDECKSICNSMNEEEKMIARAELKKESDFVARSVCRSILENCIARIEQLEERIVAEHKGDTRDSV